MSRLFLARGIVSRRSLIAVTVLIILSLTVGFTYTLAQTSNKIKVGDTVTGTLSAESFAQVYTFDGKTADVINITATPNASGLTLAVILTGPTGTILNQVSQGTGQAATISNFALPADGAYQITVLRGSGTEGTMQGQFTLALTGTATPTQTSGAGGTTPTQTADAASSATVTLEQGFSVALTWDTSDDLNLEVRDPVGGAVNFRTPSVASGGQLASNVNGNCINTTATPSETISWPNGNVPGGSYEVNVYFVQRCAAAAVPPPAEGTTEASTATVAPTLVGAESTGTVNFAVTLTINGQALDPMRGTLNLNQQYVGSFRLDGADKVTLNPGGVITGIDLAPYTTKLSAPTALGTRTTVNGTITGANSADAWSIEGTANATLTVGLNATSGSLDPFLVLVGPNNTVITSNDDASDATRNSQILNFTLPSGGRYTIIATRFGLAIGGTEGGYTLTVGNQATASANTNTAATAVPTAVAGSGGLPTGSIEITLAWNNSADMRLLIRDPNGISVYSDNVSPDNSGVLDRMGNFKCPTDGTSTNTPVTYAYWPTNFLTAGTYEVGVWLEDRCADQQTLPQYKLTVNVRGTKVIEYTDRAAPNQQHLLTTFTVDANGLATQGPIGLVTDQFSADIAPQLNDQTNLVALQLATPVTGKIDATTPFVVYTFEATKGQRLAIVMRNTSGNLDPHLFLLSFNGSTQINQNDDVDPGKDANSRIEQNITADGTYVIVASRYGVQLGGTSGTYELTIAQTN